MAIEGNIGGGGLSTTNQIIGKNSKLTAVRVLDVILDISHPKAEDLGFYDSIGTIFFSKLDEDTSSISESSRPARPLFTFIKNYPLKGEIVFIFTSAGRQRDRVTFYLPAANMWNHPHHNALPSFASLDQAETKQDYVTSANGVSYRRVEDGSTGIDLGNTFVERLNIKPLVAYEGDSILEGRFGNSIRLGSTVTNAGITNPWSGGETTNGDPIMIIRNGQEPIDDGQSWIPTIENVSKDLSSIYLTSTQKLKGLSVASPYQNSYGGKVLEPVPDILTDIPVDPPPPEEEVEIIVETPLEVTPEAEQEIEVAAPPPPPPVVEKFIPPEPEGGDELSPFDELLEEGAYADEFQDEQDDDIGGDDFGDFPLNDGEISMDGYEVGDYEENNTNPGGQGELIEVQAPGGGKYVKQDALNDWIAEGLVSPGCNDEAVPTSYPCQITSVRVLDSVQGYAQWYLDAPISAQAMASKIISNRGPSGNANTKVKHLVVHTSAMKNADSKYLTYYFVRRKSWSSDGKNYKGWTRPGYQTMIETDGKCAQPILVGTTFGNTMQSAHSDHVKIAERGGYRIGDDPTQYNGQGGPAATRSEIKNRNSIAISWLPSNKYLDGATVKDDWGEASSKGPIGITKAQCLSIKTLIYAYIQKYPDIKVVGHNNQAGKSCPGFNAPYLVQLMHQSGNYPKISPTNYSGGVCDIYASSKYKKGNYNKGAEIIMNDGELAPAT